MIQCLHQITLLRFIKNRFNIYNKNHDNDQIRDEKLQYDINREAAKISALSSSKICKYEYLTGEDILPSNQQQIIEQAKFTYSPLGKRLDSAKKSTTDAIKTASKRAMQETAEATSELIGNKTADKITSFSKIKSNNNNNNNNNSNNNNNEDVQLTTHKKRYKSPEERQQIINELRLVP